MNANKGIELQLLTITRGFLSELQADRALQAITLDASLERELGIDSLGKVELFHRIEQAFFVHLPDNAMVEAVTLRDLIKMVKEGSVNTLLRTKKQQFSPVLESKTLDLTTTSSLYEVLYTYAEKEPKRPHIYLQDEHGNEQIIQYGQLVKEAETVARGLYQRGIQPGETVAIMLPTSDAFFYTFCGVLLAGAIPVPIYPPFRADRIEEYAKREAGILRNAQARLLVTFTAAETLSNMLQTFVPSLTKALTVKNLQTSTGKLPTVTIEPDDITLIQYTSGSTGEPKGVALTHRNMLANIRAIEKAIGIKATDVSVSWLPLYHDMGLMSWLGSLYFGIPVTILSPLTFLTRPERWLWAIHYHRATISGGPNFAYELCFKKINPNEIEGLDLSSWQYAFNGAEAINPKTLERFARKFAPYGFKLESFAPVYGLAEATVGLTFPGKKRVPRIDKIQREWFEKESKAIPASKGEEAVEYVGCGEVLTDHDIRIVDDKSAELPERVVGNIQFKGPSAMQGYYNNPQATQKAFSDGWWDTGDLGYLVDKELFITGRKKDLIIKAGRNIYPEEIEEILNQISTIRKGCTVAFGISDPSTGTEKLVVVAEIYELVKTKQQAIRAEIIEKMAMELGIPPDIVILVPPRTVPKTSSGKLQRSACKQAYIEGKLSKQQLPVKLQLIKLACISAGKKIDSWFCYLGRLVYSLYVAILLVIILPIMWFLLLLLSSQNTAKMVRFFARLFFRLTFCPVTIEGKNNLQDLGSVIYVANHASYVDALALVAVLPTNIAIVAKKELLSVPIINKFIKKLNYPTVDRMDFTKSLENKSLIEAVLRQGQSIVIFPEGTFTYATGLRPFKLGAFIIATETTTSLCPVSLQGTRAILRGNNLLAKPGKIKVVVGKPVSPKGNDWHEIIRLHSIVRTEIAKNCGEPVIDIIVAGPAID